MAISKTPTGNKTPTTTIAAGQRLGYQPEQPASGGQNRKSAPLHTPPPVGVRKGFTGK